MTSTYSSVMSSMMKVCDCWIIAWILWMQMFVVVDSASSIVEVNTPFLQSPEEPVQFLTSQERTEENKNIQRQRSSAYSAPPERIQEEQDLKRQQSSTLQNSAIKDAAPESSGLKPWEPEDEPDPAEGNWGPWGSWSQCDSNCQKIRQRFCQGIPRPEGIHCRGPFQHKIDCDPDVCRHAAKAVQRTRGREELGASFHVDGRLVYRHSGVPAHAINMFIRFKPLIGNAIIIERHPPKSCHSQKCKNSIVLELVKHRLELKVKIDKQKLRVVSKNKINLNGWHTVVLLVFHSKASMSIDNRPPQTASFKKTPRPVNLDQPMRVGFMGRRVLTAKQVFKEISGYVAELRINFKSASLVSSVWNSGHLRPIREERTSRVTKEFNSMYPPFAGRQFTSFPLLPEQMAGGKTTFRILFTPRYNRNAADREIVFFLPGSDDHSYVFIGITTTKFYICVKRKIKENIACSAGHYLKDGTCTLTLVLKPTELIVRWQKKKTGKLYEQSAKLSDNDVPWEPSDVVYLGGLPTTMWNVLREEAKANSLKGFTGYIYDLTINGKLLSLREGTVYSEDGLINAFGATEADSYVEVPNTENTDNVSLTCDYSRDVNQGDVVNVKWLSGNRVIVPGRANNVNISIQDNSVDKTSRLTLDIIDNNDTSKVDKARRDMEGFYACQLNRNEERFLIAAFGITNASTTDLGPPTVWNMHFPLWMSTLALRTGVAPRMIVIFFIVILCIIALLAVGVTFLYLYHHDPAFKQWLYSVKSHHKDVKGQGNQHTTPKGGSTHDPRRGSGRHRTEIYHEPFKPSRSPYDPGNVSTNCGTDIEGDLDEMDGLLSEENQTYFDEDDFSTDGSYSGETDFDDEDDEDDDFQDDFSTDGNTLRDMASRSERLGRSRSRSRSRDRRSRSRSRSGSRDRRSRSRSRSRSPHRHRHQRHYRHRRDSNRSRGVSDSEYSYRPSVTDSKRNVQQGSSLGISSRGSGIKVNIKQNPSPQTTPVSQRRSVTNIKTTPKATTTTTTVTTPTFSAKQATPSAKVPPPPSPAKATPPRTVPAGAPASSAAGTQVSKPTAVNTQARPAPPRTQAGTVPNPPASATLKASASAGSQAKQVATPSAAAQTRHVPTPAAAAQTKQVPTPTSATQTRQVPAPSAAAQTRQVPTSTPSAAAHTRQVPTPLTATQARQVPTPIATQARQVYTPPAGTTLAPRDSRPAPSVPHEESHRIYSSENSPEVHDYSWRNPSPPYNTRAGATNYVETFPEAAQNQAYYGHNRYYTESGPGYQGSYRDYVTERQESAYPPSLGITRGCSSTSWLNINENARPYENFNENARSERNQDVNSEEQDHGQEPYSPNDATQVFTPESWDDVNESSLLVDVDNTSQDEDDSSEEAEVSPEVQENRNQSPVRAFFEEMFARMPSYHVMPSISEE